MKRYVVLFPKLHVTEEGPAWMIVEALTPKEAVSQIARTAKTDEKALVVQLDSDPIPVYAKVDWSE